MDACAKALEELRGIWDRLKSGQGRGLEHEQINVVRLIQHSQCPALRDLAEHVQHERPEEVLFAWKRLVVDGLEPTEPRLTKVATILARHSRPIRVVSTNQSTSTFCRDPWIDHACDVVAVLMSRVERIANAVTSNSHDGDGGGRKATRRERQMKWLAEAMLTVRDHPEWSDAKIAERVGIDKSRLSRSREYHAAARMARTPTTPAGSVTVANGERELEAVDDSFDPNRRASRQWQDEEDIDERIDREMEEMQRKTQRGGVKTPLNRRAGGV